MKKMYIFVAATLLATIAFAQKPTTDSTYNPAYNDTIKIGSILIIKKNKTNGNDSTNSDTDVQVQRRRKSSTNYFVIDLGFANFNDNTNYNNAGSYVVNKPGSANFSEADLKLRGGKSSNINIWFFMQTTGLVKRALNLKYGLGLELQNYHFRNPISFKENGSIPYSNGMQTNAPFVFRDSIGFSKNKLALDYLTVPLMLNFDFSKPGKNGLIASFGVSGGYLYSQRNKQKSSERGKQKNKGEYDIERFKFSYVGEVGLGKVKFYGSYTPTSIFERGLDVKPFNLGIRFSN